MKISLRYLADCPEFAAELAQWLHSEWGSFDPENTPSKNEQRLLERLNRAEIPLVYVAVDGDRAVGCVSLKYEGVSIRPQFSPWVGSMYVLPNYRRAGIGSLLLRQVLAKARELEIDRVYLWTASAENFYAKHGFQTFETLEYLSQTARLMRLELEPKA